MIVTTKELSKGLSKGLSKELSKELSMDLAADIVSNIESRFVTNIYTISCNGEENPMVHLTTCPCGADYVYNDGVNYFYCPTDIRTAKRATRIRDANARGYLMTRWPSLSMRKKRQLAAKVIQTAWRDRIVKIDSLPFDDELPGTDILYPSRWESLQEIIRQTYHDEYLLDEGEDEWGDEWVDGRGHFGDGRGQDRDGQDQERDQEALSEKKQVAMDIMELIEVHSDTLQEGTYLRYANFMKDVYTTLSQVEVGEEDEEGVPYPEEELLYTRAPSYLDENYVNTPP